MKQLALALVLLSLGLGSCTPFIHSAVAPRRWVKYYHHEQRKNERQRRRLVKTNITWSTLQTGCRLDQLTRGHPAG